MPRSSLHDDYDRAVPGKGPSNRSFGFVVGGVLSFLAVLPVLKGGSPRLPVLAVGCVLVATAAIAPRFLAQPNRAWEWLGRTLGKLVTPVALGLLFFVVFMPVAAWLRLRGKDLLRARIDSRLSSYWLERQPPGPDPESMTQQF